MKFKIFKLSSEGHTILEKPDGSQDYTEEDAAKVIEEARKNGEFVIDSEHKQIITEIEQAQGTELLIVPAVVQG